jgi:hypothetical protein
MSCIPCSKVSNSEKDPLKFYVKRYKDTGHEVYVYRLDKNSLFKFVEKSLFVIILNNEIKPNFEKGAEYFHISEFTGDIS